MGFELVKSNYMFVFSSKGRAEDSSIALPRRQAPRLAAFVETAPVGIHAVLVT